MSPELLEKYEDALKKIASMAGMCIYGIPELMDAPPEILKAFRLGSGLACDELAKVAKEALCNPEV